MILLRKVTDAKKTFRLRQIFLLIMVQVVKISKKLLSKYSAAAVDR